MVDIICPVYNGGESFSESLRSIGKLVSSDNINVIISDNHSTDGRPWLLEVQKLRESGWNVSIITPQNFMDRIEHWNWAFNQGSARLVKPLLVGDCLLPNYFKNLLSVFDENQNVAFAGSGYIVQFPEKRAAVKPVIGKKVFDQSNYLEININRGNIAGPLSALLFNRKALVKALPFDIEYPWTSDWRLFMRASKEGGVVLLDEPLCLFNQKKNRFSTRSKNIWKSIKEEWQVRSTLMAEYGNMSLIKRFWINSSKAVFCLIAKYGRAFIPTKIRKPMGKLYIDFIKLRGVFAYFI